MKALRNAQMRFKPSQFPAVPLASPLLNKNRRRDYHWKQGSFSCFASSIVLASLVTFNTQNDVARAEENDEEEQSKQSEEQILLERLRDALNIEPIASIDELSCLVDEDLHYVNNSDRSVIIVLQKANMIENLMSLYRIKD
mmetsp:Transcript_11243/g.18924  ORF Transcript_11243/g.18924 Transcript_11243/m.18924 type:complete len:141 (-) Transcript_11243:2655-3077(-)